MSTTAKGWIALAIMSTLVVLSALFAWSQWNSEPKVAPGYTVIERVVEQPVIEERTKVIVEKPSDRIEEDEAGWNCRTMGNRHC